MIDEASVEHAAAKDLIAQIRAMERDDALFDDKVKVLSEQTAHHVKEEEGGIFPKARKDKLDLAAPGLAIARRKAQLLSEMA